MTDLYAILGVTRDADPETIKAAYRAKAKRLHPDQGGGADEFAELQRAYELLSDPQKRARYDETGSADDGVQDNDREAIGMVCAAFQQAMDAAQDVARSDIVAGTKQLIRQSQKSCFNQRSGNEAKLRKLRAVHARVKRQGAGPDQIGGLLSQMIRETEGAIKMLDRHAEIHLRSLEIVEDYAYAVEPPAPPTQNAQAMGTLNSAMSQAWFK